jgi:hypothetical protein
VPRKLSLQRVAGSIASTIVCLLFARGVAVAQEATTRTEYQKDVLVGSSLTKGFDIGIDSSEHVKDWVRQLPGYIEVAFPAYQEWAAVFITMGKPVDLPRNSWMDLSAYKILSIEMRGE